VGLNSDSSTRVIKGPTRPLNTQEDRKAMLEELRSVDEVIVFYEKTPLRLIQNLLPDTIVKGSDYAEDQVVGCHLAEVVIFDIIHGYSTTKTIQDSSHR
jgi:D-beta-D-heptose 7-phosphate kinase/D-beta-D-heptose 1-phosphate adenosyltransferase